MSVDRRAGLAYGYLVSDAECREMNKVSNYEFEDEFICVNAYDSDTDYILGAWAKVLFEGDCVPLDLWSVVEALPADYNHTLIDMTLKMNRPDLADRAPQVYLIYQVS